MEITEFALLDMAQALARLDNDKSLYAELITFFLNEPPFTAETLRKRLSEPENTGPALLSPAAQYVHRIKGAAGNIGADKLYAVAGMLEQVLRGKADGDVSELAALTETCYIRTAAALKSLVL